MWLLRLRRICSMRRILWFSQKSRQLALFAATLLVKALGLEADATAKVNTQLTFKDEDKIPAGSVGYVAVATEKGIVTGYDNNTFRPNQPVTRAELAALLDRTDEEMPDNDAQAIQVS